MGRYKLDGQTILGGRVGSWDRGSDKITKMKRYTTTDDWDVRLMWDIKANLVGGHPKGLPYKTMLGYPELSGGHAYMKKSKDLVRIDVSTLRPKKAKPFDPKKFLKDAKALKKAVEREEIK